MITFYKILEEALKGKIVIMRSYDNENESIVYDDDNIPSWNEEETYYEWQGTVNSILYNDNSHFDVIFEKDEYHKFPIGFYEDCYNWHMGEYIKIIS